MSTIDAIFWLSAYSAFLLVACTQNHGPVAPCVDGEASFVWTAEVRGDQLIVETRAHDHAWHETDEWAGEVSQSTGLPDVGTITVFCDDGQEARVSFWSRDLQE